MIFDDIANYIKCINLGYYPSKGKITNLIIKQMNYISNDILNVPEEYKEILRFNDENSEVAKAKQKELYLAKKELDELDVVIKYNKAY